MTRILGLFAILLAACGGGGSGYYFTPTGDLSMIRQAVGDEAGQPPSDLSMQAAGTCHDGVQNQNESDKDCGGVCAACANGLHCNNNSDCQSAMCAAGVCAPAQNPPTCNDNIKNQNETDVDCGGGTCPACANGKHCILGSDCQNNSCINGVCMAPKATAPVGGKCGGPADCSGNNSTCLTMLGNINAPGGYCSNQPCAGNNDCGAKSFCPVAQNLNYCVGLCTGKNECQQTNSSNRCFYWDNTYNACLPSTLSACDPTSGASCNHTGACQRDGIDNVGTCFTTCAFGAACPADGQGQAQNCYFYNQRIDTLGNPSPDVFQGLACGIQNSAGTLGSACTYLNDCVTGFECDFYSLSGSKVCKPLCRSGMNGDCNAGACQNAFKLGNFGFGAIGLCI